jgi:hypothetical protein
MTMEKKQPYQRLSDTITEVLVRYAAKHGISIWEAKMDFVKMCKDDARREKMGPMPHEYDPKNDEDHLMNGYKG